MASPITATESVILDLLRGRQKRYGLELVKASDGKLKRGGIYVLLDRLEDKGLIESEKVETPKGERGPARRVYRITGAGSQVLNAWETYQASLAGAMEGGAA